MTDTEFSSAEATCSPLRSVVRVVAAIAVLILSGCGGDETSSTIGATPEFIDLPSDAETSNVQLVGIAAGASPFIARLYLSQNQQATLKTIEFTIQPKSGAASKPVDVTYTQAALVARGYATSYHGAITLPVFGLYAGYANLVTLRFGFVDGSSKTLTTTVSTADYVDPTGLYLQPTILQQRAAGTTLGFDFFYIKSGVEAPVVIDTDGEIRWAVPGITDAVSAALQGDEFVIGDASAPIVHRVRLDGTTSQNPMGSNVTIFHHNIDRGKVGLLADVNTDTNGAQNIESTVMEISTEGNLLDRWDLAATISAYMQSQGDDASAFVRQGSDWFHNNASAYDPSDDSVIVSSRENFVIKLDYKTGAIIWILGDPTKYWYTFPSLRAKALTLAPGGLYPIGQHAVSITPDGHLTLFNDGLGSVNQPVGAPPGQTRVFSAVSSYSIDGATMSAQNIWNFENGQSIFSPICSSAYGTAEHSLLIDYATADNETEARLVGLDSNHNKVFDFQYSTQGCTTSWNAVPIAFDNLTIN